MIDSKNIWIKKMECTVRSVWFGKCSFEANFGSLGIKNILLHSMQCIIFILKLQKLDSNERHPKGYLIFFALK